MAITRTGTGSAQPAEAGFTMVELLIAMVISGITMMAMYSTYKYQRDVYEVQNQITEMQQNIRAALWYMVPEIRTAGLDPTQSAGAGIIITDAAANLYSKANRISFSQDLTDDSGNGDSDGDTDDQNETVSYGFSNTYDPDGDGIIAGGGAAPLGRNTGGGFQPIADNIAAIEFSYTLKDGTKVLAPTDVQASNIGIKAVAISILARAEYPDRNYTNSMSYKTASGTTWGPYNDHYRRYLLTTTVLCRNLGM